MGPLLWDMKVAGLSHRQMAEALNEHGVPVPSQQSGVLGNTILRPAPGPRRLWNKTQVQRVLKHLDDVSAKMRWWRRWMTKKIIASPDDFEALMALLGDVERDEHRLMMKARHNNRIEAARKRRLYREKVLKGEPLKFPESA